MSSLPESFKLSSEELRGLAPERLRSFLPERYCGGRFTASMETDFTPEEREILRRMYEELGKLMQLAQPRGEDDLDEGNRALEEFCAETKVGTMAMELEQAGKAAEGMHDTVTSGILREITKGPFASIYGILFLAQQGVADPGFFSNLFYLARDQLKIMRSFILDLDPEKRAEDEVEKYHSIQLLLEKWQGASYAAFDNELKVDFETEFTGHVAERCVEFAELDRLFYHLANNAVQHGGDPALMIQVQPTEDSESLRFAFINPIREEQYDLLDQLISSGESLFDRSVCIRGKGFGLSVVAESVAHAYGLESRHQAVAGKYVGLRLDPHRFLVWFHWPMVGSTV